MSTHRPTPPRPHTVPVDPHAPPGIRVHRRELLGWPVLAAAIWSLASLPLRAQDATPAGTDALAALDFTAFAAEWKRLAGDFRAAKDTRDEVLLGAMLALIARLGDKGAPLRAGELPATGFTGGPLLRDPPIIVIEFDFAPGAELPPHNHSPLVDATTVAAGEFSYRHWEVEGQAPTFDPPDPTPFTLRETRRGLLRANGVTTLTRQRDGLHGFRAGPQGGRIVDYFVALEDSQSFSYVKVGDARGAGSDLYEARWLGMGG
jgi:hypothetical protein